MTIKEAREVLKTCTLPDDEAKKMQDSALTEKTSWENIKARLSRNLKGRIRWSTPIYRTIPFVSLLRLHLDKTCLFSRYENWEDPYENYWLRKRFLAADGGRVSFAKIAKGFFAQCWSLNPDSIALWKTATKDPTLSSAVRIESTIEDYCRALCSGIQSGYLRQIEEHLFFGKVQYRSQTYFDRELDCVVSRRMEERLISSDELQDKAISTLLTKRDAFSFEEEFRFILDTKGIPPKKLFRQCKDRKCQKIQLLHLNDDVNFMHGVVINPWSKSHEVAVLRKEIERLYPGCDVRQSGLLESV